MSEPYCLAMVLCDAAHRDPATGKWTILGTFSTVGSQQYPTQIQMCAYWSITDVVGSIDLTLRLVDSADLFSDETKPVFEHMMQLDSPSPLAAIEGVMLVRTVLPKPAVYHCELLDGDNLLMSRRLVAIEPPEDSSEEMK